MGIKSLLGKGKEMAEDRADVIKAGIGKAESLADKATRGKISDKIGAVGDKLEKLVPEGGGKPKG
jgi:hypothetical protein